MPQLALSVCTFVHALPHSCWPVPQSQLPQSQPVEHVCVPRPPHARVVPALHCFSFPHADHVAVPVLGLHVLVCTPQLPQLRIAGSLQVCPTQSVPHAQLAVHVCVPFEPHVRVACGAHAPWPMHADHADGVPVAVSHVRV